MDSIGTTLLALRNRHSMTQAEVAHELEKAGVRATRHQISRWENGINSPSIEQFLGLCRIYNISDVYRTFALHDFSELVYSLNKAGREKLEEYKQLLIDSGKYAPIQLERKAKIVPLRTRPLYDIGASAGTGQFLDSDSYEMVEVPDDVPDSATFALHVCGDSMEPTLLDGEMIWVHQQPVLENGDIGIFLNDGNAFVKEFQRTDKGTFLISHNEKYKPIKVTQYSESRIYGKVVYPCR